MTPPLRTRVSPVGEAAFTEPPAWDPSPKTIVSYRRLSERAAALGDRPGVNPANASPADIVHEGHHGPPSHA